jgi:pimeloyl-ACP methyl ester carboxylesterase
MAGRATVDRLLDRIDAFVWSRGLRHWQRPELVPAAEGGPSLTVEQRLTEPFDYELVRTRAQHPIEIEGRLYNYVFYPGRDDALCIHFSAFFDASGERRRFREFRGYFHRLRMFWPFAAHSFLFLVDTFGAEENGCYYKGLDNDFFVERAMDRIIERVSAEHGATPARIVTLGSSMGATGAIRVALRHGFAGIVAVSPHIDLDISALRQGRLPHVAAILGSEDVAAERFRPVTREIRRLAAGVPRLPRLAIQSMLDDDGVHAEQVLPLVDLWRSRGGAVAADYRETGGHTSDHATPEYFRTAIGWCLSPR